MEVQFTREHEAFIIRSVESGRFSSPEAAVREAVELLARSETELQGTREFVREGLTDLETGQYEEFGDDNLHELFDGVISRGRERLAAQRTPRP
jgi:putative addiction module CopG family antidote